MRAPDEMMLCKGNENVCEYVFNELWVTGLQKCITFSVNSSILLKLVSSFHIFTIFFLNDASNFLHDIATYTDLECH